MTLYREPEIHVMGMGELASLCLEIEDEEEKFILDHGPEDLIGTADGRMLLRYLDDEHTKATVWQKIEQEDPPSKPVILGDFDFQKLKMMSFSQYSPGFDQSPLTAMSLLKIALTFEAHWIESLEKLCGEMDCPQRLVDLIEMNKKTQGTLAYFLN